MAGRGRGATLPSWMTSQDSNYQIPGITVVDAEADRYSNAPQSRDADGVNEKHRKEGDRDRHSERERSRDKKRRQRSSSRSRSRNKKGEKSDKESSSSLSWRPKSNRSSNFDVRPPPGVELPPIGGVASNAYNNPSGPPRDSSLSTRHGRRIYVGGIPPTSLENEIQSFFNDIVIKYCPPDAIPTGGLPVMGVFLNLDKCFAFVEFPSIELATALMKLDGIPYQHGGMTYTLRVRRPHDYRPELLPPCTSVPNIQIPWFTPSLAAAAPTPSGPGKVFVGGLPITLSDQKVQEILSAFGPLKSFNLVKEAGTPYSKGYAFCEYCDEITTAIAIEGLNSITIADKKLMAQLADRSAANAMNMALLTDISSLNNGAMAAQNIPTPSKIVKLVNMITSQDIQHDDDWRDIMEDTERECSNYGRVVKVTIPRIKDGFSSEGEVLVEFDSIEGASKAYINLNGRKFDGRPVVATFEL